MQVLQLQLISCKNISQIASKIFTTWYFFNDLRTLNKTTFIMSVVNPL